MLDTDTKRRIDTARDILVGKVPDPKSQVEQITIALIYKFMNDMDAEAEEFGGKRKFFADEFARYGWPKLMRSGLGGFDTLNLYAEAIAKMPENPGIPPLFRDIFKNAYLPYRDPETLKMFLKVIDEFNYDHSERLGDAFEYLLSVLGSQGDAGQFRTPRHIIDFIVEVVDPKKNETVLDPACGTAGFLISSYKHILNANTDDKGNSALTPDEKGRLAQNFKGYDISPDMVRLSLVNLYLHGFADPHIAEYDTLTSQDRWNEYADVILANPPFMSPKGGIKPHNRFSVQSKRSEVLFVDYMAEHLTPTGRAGIIVPEGIIFQSQTAYKDLRKMLVENSLVAVVSLPGGVFNPYSGVKTSILILDKSLAKKADTIGFFKIENDGFGLGAQRREIDKNDRPLALVEIGEYLHRLLVGESVEDFQPTLGLIVPKEKVAANGDYNLSGERYRVGLVRQLHYPIVKLGELAENLDSKRVPITQGDRKSGPYPYYGASGIVDRVDGFIFDEDLLLISEDGANLLARSTPIAFSVSGKCWVNNHAHVLRFQNPATQKLIEVYLNSISIEKYITGAAQPKLNQQALNDIQIPFPPLEVQKEIVAEIEGYQKVINGACIVLDNYHPRIPIHPDWPMGELGELVEDMHQGINTAGLKIEFVDHGIPIIQSRNITSGALDFKNIKYMSTDDWMTYRDKYKPQINDVLFTNIGTIGKSIVVSKDEDYLIHWNIFIIKTGPRLNPKYLKTYLDYLDGIQYFTNMQRGGTVQFVSKKQLFETLIALPPLTTQEAIVAEIEAEQALVAANRELIERFEKKIQTTIARVWGEDESIAVTVTGQ